MDDLARVYNLQSLGLGQGRLEWLYSQPEGHVVKSRPGASWTSRS